MYLPSRHYIMYVNAYLCEKMYFMDVTAYDTEI